MIHFKLPVWSLRRTFIYLSTNINLVQCFTAIRPLPKIHELSHCCSNTTCNAAISSIITCLIIVNEVSVWAHQIIRLILVPLRLDQRLDGRLAVFCLRRGSLYWLQRRSQSLYLADVSLEPTPQVLRQLAHVEVSCLGIAEDGQRAVITRDDDVAPIACGIEDIEGIFVRRIVGTREAPGLAKLLAWHELPGLLQRLLSRYRLCIHGGHRHEGH